MFNKRRKQPDPTPVTANPYEALVTGSSPGVERGLFWDASCGQWRDRDLEASEATRVASLEAAAQSRQEARDAGELDGIEYRPHEIDAANVL